MIIKVHEPETLSLQFPYNPSIIQEIKQIRGYRWNPDQKIWTLPNTDRVIKELQARFPTAFWDGAAKAAPERVSSRVMIEDIDASDIPDRPEGFRPDCPALRPYQKIGAKFCVTNERVLLADAMGCVSGDAVITVYGACVQAVGPLPMSLSDLYAKFDSISHGERKDVWCLSFHQEAGRFGLHKISSVVDSGVRNVLKITTNSGRSLRLTADHEVLVRGTYEWTRADELKIGTPIITCGGVELRILDDDAFDYVTAIEADGETHVYDIKMVDEPHNFVANGIVVHNCGKTSQAIAAVELAKKQNCLIVCQAANLETWNQEISKWTGRVSIEINARNRKKLEKTKALDFKQMVLEKKYVVTNYEMLGKFPFLKAFHWDAVVIDEAHNFRGRRSLRLKHARDLKSSTLLALTGTPIINRPIEMFNNLDMLTRGDFGTFEDFWERYCGGATKQVMVGAYCPMCGARRKTINDPCWKCRTVMPADRRYRDVPDYSVSTNMDDLKHRLKGVMIARKRSEVLTELPDYQRIDKVVAMTAEQQRQYDQVMTNLLTYLLQHKRKDLESAIRSTNSETLTRIGYARQHLAMCKVAAAVSDAREAMESGDNVIVFTNYQEVAFRAKELIEAGTDDDHGFRCFLFTGANAGTSRTLQIAEWQRTPGSALVCTIEAGGVGLNLQVANRSFFIDMPWTPAIIAQAEARTLRMGQKKETFFTRYFIKDTYDEKLMKMLADKQAIFNKVLDGELDVAGVGDDLIGGVVDDILDAQPKKGKKK